MASGQEGSISCPRNLLKAPGNSRRHRRSGAWAGAAPAFAPAEFSRLDRPTSDHSPGARGMRRSLCVPAKATEWSGRSSHPNERLARSRRRLGPFHHGDRSGRCEVADFIGFHGGTTGDRISPRGSAVVGRRDRTTSQQGNAGRVKFRFELALALVDDGEVSFAAGRVAPPEPLRSSPVVERS